MVSAVRLREREKSRKRDSDGGGRDEKLGAVEVDHP